MTLVKSALQALLSDTTFIPEAAFKSLILFLPTITSTALSSILTTGNPVILHKVDIHKHKVIAGQYREVLDLTYTSYISVVYFDEISKEGSI
jgi:hypothetical protein